MGLDITAYSHLKHIGKHEIDPDNNEGEPGPHCYADNHVHAFAYDSFPQSFRGLPILSTESWGDGTGYFEAGCMETTEQTEEIDFHAGSYTGYNYWRSDLQRQFNPDTKPDLPFYELIWFADNEGSIGPEAAADLLADFREHADRYVLPEHYASYPKIYGNWTRACELAANSGLIRFH